VQCGKASGDRSVIFTAILVACLASAPSECKTHEFRLMSALPTAQWKEAETRAGEWIAKHSGYEKRSLVVKVGREA
jgi:hypothetical protein